VFISDFKTWEVLSDKEVVQLLATNFSGTFSMVGPMLFRRRPELDDGGRCKIFGRAGLPFGCLKGAKSTHDTPDLWFVIDHFFVGPRFSIPSIRFISCATYSGGVSEGQP
jgi:hypothetical protein